METTLTLGEQMADSNTQITDIVLRERERLGNFIRRRVADPGDAEDILQDVFFQFAQAYRLPEPIEQAGAWLFRVARNRIIDRFRKKKEEALPEMAEYLEEDRWIEEVFPPADGGPEAAYARSAFLKALQLALDELPPEQREVFVAHELEGRSFKTLAEATGVGVNTLLARKRYAVLHLRERLQTIYDEFDF